MKLRYTQFLLPMIAFFAVSAAHALPNPASKFCTDQGGELEFVSIKEKGTEGLCTFGKAAIDQWTLFYFKASVRPQAAVTAFCKSQNNPASAIAQPETVFCKSVGGTPVEAETTAKGSGAKLCYFEEDKSTIEQWTLFLGPKHPDNLNLNRVIGCQLSHLQ